MNNSFTIIDIFNGSDSDNRFFLKFNDAMEVTFASFNLEQLCNLRTKRRPFPGERYLVKIDF